MKTKSHLPLFARSCIVLTFSDVKALVHCCSRSFIRDGMPSTKEQSSSAPRKSATRRISSSGSIGLDRGPFMTETPSGFPIAVYYEEKGRFKSTQEEIMVRIGDSAMYASYCILLGIYSRGWTRGRVVDALDARQKRLTRQTVRQQPPICSIAMR